MKVPRRARREEQKASREERRRLAESSALASDEASVQRLREVAETQLALQADYLMGTDELGVLLARRAIEARELNIVQLDRKQLVTSRGVLALLVACLTLGALALIDPGVQSKHVPRPRPHISRQHRCRHSKRRQLCRFN